MFIMHSYVEKMKSAFETVNNCLIFWPEEDEIPELICKKHAVVKSANTHLEFCRFFNSHNITNFCQNENVVSRDNYVLVGNVSIEEGAQVFPYVYINGDVHIGKNCYIGAGAKIIGNVYIGDNVLIKENAVIGTGVIINASTAIFDATTGEYIRANEKGQIVVPSGAVVVAGSRPVSKGPGADQGIHLYCPVIVKYRDEKTSGSITLEDMLR